MALGRRFGRNGDGQSDRGGVATRERPARAPQRTTGDRRAGDGSAATTTTGRDAYLRRREEFTGLNWGAAFFGWLVAVGMAVILIAIVSAAGAALGLSTSPSKADAGTIGIVGGALLVAILALAYYCGGYVAGRMSRFDGARQGFAVWLFGLMITLLVAGAGAVFGDQYNVFEKLNLPRIPVSASDVRASP